MLDFGWEEVREEKKKIEKWLDSVREEERRRKKKMKPCLFWFKYFNLVLTMKYLILIFLIFMLVIPFVNSNWNLMVLVFGRILPMELLMKN